MHDIIDIQATEIKPLALPAPKFIYYVCNKFELRKGVWITVEIPCDYTERDHIRLTGYLKHFYGWGTP